MSQEQRNYVSGGRNPNVELTCGYPKCDHLKQGVGRDGGWCQHPANRVPPSEGWPDGFTPSVSSCGGCDLHTGNAGVDAAPNAVDGTSNEGGA